MRSEIDPKAGAEMTERHDGPRQKSILDQLAPVAIQMRRDYSLVRSVSQASLEIRPVTEGNVFALSRGLVIDWISGRSGRPLPANAWKGEDFELEDIGSQRTAAVSIQEPQYWAAQIEDSDRNTPQRSWVTEIGIAERPDRSVLLGTRLLCVTRGEDRPFEPSLPRFVRTIIEQMPNVFLEGRRVGPQLWIIRTEQDVEDLVATLKNPGRRLDVIVCALPEGSENIYDTSIDAWNVHQKTHAAAHVAVITASASFLLSDHLGKEFSVFRGAVRTYRANLNIYEDEPFRHPLSLPNKIAEWQQGGKPAFERFLIQQALTRSGYGNDVQQRIPTFSEVRRIAAQLKSEAARNTGLPDADQLELAKAEVIQLRDTLKTDQETYQGLVDQYERERDEALEDAQQIRASNAFLRQRLRLLESENKSQPVIATRIGAPQSLDDFEGWCRNNLSGAVDVLNRAMHGVKKSQYENESFMYEALIVLRDYYVPMKREGGADRKRDFDEACQRLGLSEDSTFSGARWGEQGDQYLVRYSGQMRLLDRHLKKGNSKDPRYCFRLYFFWDEETEQVVVGWLPSHLDTRIT